ncbi:MAG: zinc-ribbon domain-containing protein [Chloroflexota bacterium]|nr:MAG: hypothetical protein KatS3mg045_0990 [Bellilinea sp.]
MDLGSVLLILALALLVGMILTQPFMRIKETEKLVQERKTSQEKDHIRSALLAEQERVLAALQELEFDYTLGKIPAEDYPNERAALLKHGADILRQLDALQPTNGRQKSAEERIEAAVAARRADAAAGRPVTMVAELDEVELAILERKRQQSVRPAGFCPKCGNPVTEVDRFCSRCGNPVEKSLKNR